MFCYQDDLMQLQTGSGFVWSHYISKSVRQVSLLYSTLNNCAQNPSKTLNYTVRSANLKV